MQDLENINQIVLDPFGNIYEMNTFLTVMTLLRLNHFWITQPELCKSKFRVCFRFLDIYENSLGKTLLTRPVPRILK